MKVGEQAQRVGDWIRVRPLTVAFVALLTLAESAEAWVTRSRFDTLVAWASTNVARLRTEPVGPLAVSVFVVDGHRLLWLALAALAFALVEPRLGWVRALSIGVAAQVFGTLISEGIVWWRVTHGRSPSSALHQVDVGVSYVVVAVLTAAVLVAGSRWGRICAAVTLLVIAPDLLSGLNGLQVSAVGHLVAIVIGGISGTVESVAPEVRRRNALSRGDGRVPNRL